MTQADATSAIALCKEREPTLGLLFVTKLISNFIPIAITCVSAQPLQLVVTVTITVLKSPEHLLWELMSRSAIKFLSSSHTLRGELAT
eukprot:3062295-Amphidinium_carterae.2